MHGIMSIAPNQTKKVKEVKVMYKMLSIFSET